MKVRYLGVLLGTIAFVAILLLVFRDERVELRWRLNDGQVLRVRMTWEILVGSVESYSVDRVYTVSSVNSDGLVTLRGRILNGQSHRA